MKNNLPYIQTVKFAFEVNSLNLKFVTFDLFDTLIKRRFGLSSNLEKNNLFQKLSIFFKIKNQAEFIKDFDNSFRSLLKKSKKEDIYLLEIYKDLIKNPKYSHLYADRLLDQHLSLEVSRLFIDERIKDLINSSTTKLNIVSDTLYSKKELKYFLNKLGVNLSKVNIFSSADYGLLKKTGNLFKKISKEKIIKYENWLHVGDNLLSDFNIPKSLGINCLHFSDNLTKRNIIKFYQNKVSGLNTKDKFDNFDDFYLNSSILSNKYVFFHSYICPIIYGFKSYIDNFFLSHSNKQIVLLGRDMFLFKDFFIKNKSNKYYYADIGRSLASRLDPVLSKKNSLLSKGEILRKYILFEGLNTKSKFDFNKEFYFVDIGHSGYIQSIFQNNGFKVKGLYLFVKNNIEDNLQKKNYDSLFHENIDKHFSSIYRIYLPLFEFFLSSPYDIIFPIDQNPLHKKIPNAFDSQQSANFANFKKLINPLSVSQGLSSEDDIKVLIKESFSIIGNELKIKKYGLWMSKYIKIDLLYNQFQYLLNLIPHDKGPYKFFKKTPSRLKARRLLISIINNKILNFFPYHLLKKIDNFLFK
jgi:predicted HAD superfamily hydrolase